MYRTLKGSKVSLFDVTLLSFSIKCEIDSILYYYINITSVVQFMCIMVKKKQIVITFNSLSNKYITCH